jgi:small multidrug resistance pump
MHAWLLLSGAIITELVATTALKYSDGMTRLVPGIIVGLGYATTFWCLSRAIKDLPLGVAYAVWAGVGVAAMRLIGAVLWKEPLDWVSGLGTLMIIFGVIMVHAPFPSR